MRKSKVRVRLVDYHVSLKSDKSYPYFLLTNEEKKSSKGKARRE